MKGRRVLLKPEGPKRCDKGKVGFPVNLDSVISIVGEDAKLQDAITKIEGLDKKLTNLDEYGNRLTKVEAKVEAGAKFAWVVIGGLVTEFFVILWAVGKKIWMLPK